MVTFYIVVTVLNLELIEKSSQTDICMVHEKNDYFIDSARIFLFDTI